MRKRSRSIKLTFASTRQSQAGVADLFAAFSGRELPPKCSDCGGVTDADATCPRNGRCGCVAEASAGASLDKEVTP